MKNKKLQYVLIPAVILIWGAIGYSVFNHLKQDPEMEQLPYLPAYTDGKNVPDEENYTLLNNYRDPFRRYSPVKKTKTVEKKEKQPVRRNAPNRPQQRIYWPGIVYNGVIVNDERELALLQIAGSSVIMTTGETHAEIKLIKLYTDSVRLEYKGEQNTYVKNK